MPDTIRIATCLWFDNHESACGWCKDKFGLSWQIVPRALTAALHDPDTAAARRAMNAMMTRPASGAMATRGRCGACRRTAAQRPHVSAA